MLCGWSGVATLRNHYFCQFHDFTSSKKFRYQPLGVHIISYSRLASDKTVNRQDAIGVYVIPLDLFQLSEKKKIFFAMTGD